MQQIKSEQKTQESECASNILVDNDGLSGADQLRWN